MTLHTNHYLIITTTAEHTDYCFEHVDFYDDRKLPELLMQVMQTTLNILEKQRGQKGKIISVTKIN